MQLVRVREDSSTSNALYDMCYTSSGRYAPVPAVCYNLHTRVREHSRTSDALYDLCYNVTYTLVFVNIHALVTHSISVL